MCGDPCHVPARHSCGACSAGPDDATEYELADLVDEEA